MSALDHALGWVRGELIEAVSVIAFGVLLLACGGLLWKFGTTPAPRAMILPMLVLGVLIVSAVTPIAVNNFRRVSEFSEAFENDPAGFVDQEIERVRGFSSWYVYTFAAATILIVVGLAVFIFVSSPAVRAIALSLIVLGAVALFVDYFSEDRATHYLNRLTALQE